MDVLEQPDEAWQVSGENKQLLIVLLVVGCRVGFNLIAGLVHWFAIRRKLQQPDTGGHAAR